MKLLFSGFIIILTAVFQTQYKVPDGVKEALRTGKAKSLVFYMENKVALTLLEDDDIYVKADVEKKLTAFFYANKPMGFSIQFEGGKDANQYAIGILRTANGDYRVTMLLRSNKISQLRIEKEE